MIVDSLPFYGLVFSPQATVALLMPQAQAIHDQMLAAPDASFAAMVGPAAAHMVTSPENASLITANSLSSKPHCL